MLPIVAILPIIYIITALIIIITKKPLVVSAAAMRITLMLIFLPIFFGHGGNIVMPGMMYILIVIMLLKQSKGYIIYGIKNPALRTSMVATLNSGNIKYTEGMTGITILQDNILLETQVASIGVSRVYVKKQHKEWLGQFATQLKGYYASNPVEMTYTYTYFSLAFGILMTATLFNTFMSFISRHPS